MPQDAMEKRILSSEQLTAWNLERVGQYDNLIRSVIELNPDTLAIAEAQRFLVTGWMRCSA
ncbi:hypothetical protein [Paenibacillus protaetiae]|uniref:hypothetical protein n=1 Tax=Paenibacillus protaetiae TaxID=2509456 RepID=UPI0013EB63BF|nr:hypothetical protein [Paenibacillus protaetiae]